MKKSVKEKKERALGAKLFLKAERCGSPKCVMVRRPYRPGEHGHDRRRRISDYGKQLQEKQKLQFTYGLTNRQLKKVFEEHEGDPKKIAETLETRLDRIVYLSGLAPSVRVARQEVSHGHILINGRKTTIPSYHVKENDVISIRPASRGKGMFLDLDERLKNYTPPEWLQVNPHTGDVKRVGTPSLESMESFDVGLVGEFY